MKLAIYGYDTDIGKLVIETIEEQDLSLGEVFPLSPLTGEYDAVQIKGQNYFVQPVEEFDFSKADVALFLTTQDESQHWINAAREKGCIVIDDSHLFNGDDKTVTIVPEINPFDIKKAIENRLVIPALAPSVQLCLALSVLHDEYGIARATVTSMESVSEFGRLGTVTLAHVTSLLLNGLALDHEGFTVLLAFFLHTRLGLLEDNGYSDHENAISNEVSRILGRFERGFDITCIQVPVFYGHTMVVNVDLEDKATLEEVKQAFDASEYVTVASEDDVLSPVADIINERTVMLTRLKQDKPGSKSYSFVIMMDNTRRGEAISCVEIAKLIAKSL